MDPNLTKEDILVFVIMISLFYGIMTFFQRKMVEYFEFKKRLYRWGMNIKLSETQNKYLLELWKTYKNNYKPSDKTDNIVTELELEELVDYSTDKKLPDELKKAFKTKKHLKKINQLIEKGFNKSQAIIIYGILFNKIAGIHAIRKFGR